MFWFYSCMNNASLNTNSLRQPTPSLDGDIQKQQKRKIEVSPVTRKFNAPVVGTVDVPSISKTPIADTLVIKRQENPRTIYKLTGKSKSGFNFQNFSSLIIVGCSLVALLSGKKKS